MITFMHLEDLTSIPTKVGISAHTLENSLINPSLQPRAQVKLGDSAVGTR